MLKNGFFAVFHQMSFVCVASNDWDVFLICGKFRPQEAMGKLRSLGAEYVRASNAENE